MKLYPLSFAEFLNATGNENLTSLLATKDFELITSFKGRYKGALTEQYVLQQLITNRELTPYYWSAEKSSGEIDFVFQSGPNIVPLEVKATENLQAKSLKNYCLKYKPKYAIRTSMSDYRKEERLTNLPLYAINAILNILE